MVLRMFQPEALFLSTNVSINETAIDHNEGNNQMDAVTRGMLGSFLGVAILLSIVLFCYRMRTSRYFIPRHTRTAREEINRSTNIHQEVDIELMPDILVARLEPFASAQSRIRPLPTAYELPIAALEVDAESVDSDNED